MEYISYKQYKKQANRNISMQKLGIVKYSERYDKNTLMGYMEYIRDNGCFERVETSLYEYVVNGDTIFTFRYYLSSGTLPTIYFQFFNDSFVYHFHNLIKTSSVFEEIGMSGVVSDFNYNEVNEFLEDFINDII